MIVDEIFALAEDMLLEEEVLSIGLFLVSNCFLSNTSFLFSFPRNDTAFHKWHIWLQGLYLGTVLLNLELNRDWNTTAWIFLPVSSTTYHSLSDFSRGAITFFCNGDFMKEHGRYYIPRSDWSLEAAKGDTTFSAVKLSFQDKLQRSNKCPWYTGFSVREWLVTFDHSCPDNWGC